MLSLQEFVQNRYNKTIAECSNEELYLALLNYSKLASSQKPVNTGKKKVYYISAEFLIGKLLSNNLINLGLYDDVKKELAAAGKDLIEVEEVELEPSLGNGGLGRLAACFIDSISTLGLNACVKASKSMISFVSTTSVVSNLTGKSLLVLTQQHLVSG